jgi:hypothetical protein
LVSLPSGCPYENENADKYYEHTQRAQAIKARWAFWHISPDAFIKNPASNNQEYAGYEFVNPTAHFFSLTSFTI